jgi:hypothetical protein
MDPTIMTGPLHPTGPELARRNRRVFAERLRWPEGALEACEAIDQEHPGWTASYRHAQHGGDPAGYYANRWVHDPHDPGKYGATPDELRAALPSEHIAERPSWTCALCGKPWPCQPARKRLAAENDSVQLAMHAWLTLEEAVADMPNLPVAIAFDRFLAWTRPHPPNPNERPDGTE